MVAEDQKQQNKMQADDEPIITNHDQEIAKMIMAENKYTEVLSDGEEDEEALDKDGKPLVDMSKLLDGPNADKDGLRQMGRDVIICRDLSQVQDMYEKSNIMKGIKPLDQQEKDKPKDDKKDEPKIF